MSATSIGLVTIATGRYAELLPALIDSARVHFFPDTAVKLFVFTDAVAVPPGVERLPVEHEPWPRVTLSRYRYFTQAAERFSGLDYLFFIDVDMRFVGRCGEETLPDLHERLVAVEHPDYWRGHRGFASRAIDALSGGRWSARPLPHRRLPFERNPQSTARVSDVTHCHYYAGGFNGGIAGEFLEMARELSAAIDVDERNGVMAVWHDESHLNRYLHAHPPKRLTPAYCYPQSGYAHLAHLEPVIVALDKDHAYYRS